MLKNVFFILFSVLFSFNAITAETDQFYAYSRNAVIRDSSEELNRFYNQQITHALEKVNSLDKSLSCRETALKILNEVIGDFNLVQYYHQKTFSKVSYFVQNSPLIDRFPDDSISNEDYRDHSIYKNRPFPSRRAKLGRTINMKNTYFGTDKIGHFAIVGRNYYINFLKYLKQGKPLETAEFMAIEDGLNEEMNILGYKWSGVFSYGDLEANYRGFRFARDLCEGNQPYLIRSNERWIKNDNNPFDFKKYVNPKFDETYNLNAWRPQVWMKLQREITESYCHNLTDSRLPIRLNYYQSLNSTSVNDQVIEKFLSRWPELKRENQIFKINCPSI